jgi:hypothetical protein
MRARSVRGRRNGVRAGLYRHRSWRPAVLRFRARPWHAVLAGAVALVTLGLLVLSPLALTAIGRAVYHHEAAVHRSAGPGIGQAARDGPMVFTVRSVRCGLSEVRPGPEVFGQASVRPSNGSFCTVRVTAHNDGTGPRALVRSAQLATGSRGAVYQPDPVADAVVNPAGPALDPGTSFDATLVYDVPPEVALTGIQLRSGEYSPGVTVRL